MHGSVVYVTAKSPRAVGRYRDRDKALYGGLYVPLVLHIYLFIYFLTIPVRPIIISTSTGPIFAQFSELVELRL